MLHPDHSSCIPDKEFQNTIAVYFFPYYFNMKYYFLPDIIAFQLKKS